MQKEQIIFEQLMDLLVEATPRYDKVLKQLQISNYSEDEIDALFSHLQQIFGIEASGEELYNELFKRMTYYRDREKQKTPSYEPSNSEFIKLFTLFMKMRKEKDSLEDFYDHTGYNDFKYIVNNFGKFWLEFDRNLKEKFYKAKTWNEFVSYMKTLGKEEYGLSKFNVVFDSGKAIVIEPDIDKGDLSTLKLGAETNWCTAKGCFKELPEQYKNGVFYIILDYTDNEKPKTIFDVDAKKKYVLWISDVFNLKVKSDIVYSVTDIIESELYNESYFETVLNKFKPLKKEFISFLEKDEVSSSSDFVASFKKYKTVYNFYKNYRFIFDNIDNLDTIEKFFKLFKNNFAFDVYNYILDKISEYTEKITINDRLQRKIFLERFLENIIRNSLKKYNNLFDNLNNIIRNLNLNNILDNVIEKQKEDFLNYNVYNVFSNLESNLKDDLNNFLNYNFENIKKSISKRFYNKIKDEAIDQYTDMQSLIYDNEDFDRVSNINDLISYVSEKLIFMVVSIILEKLKDKQKIIYDNQKEIYLETSKTTLYLMEFNNYNQKIHLLDDNVDDIIKILEILDLLTFKEFSEIIVFKEQTKTKIYDYIENLANRFLNEYNKNYEYNIDKNKIIEDIISSDEIQKMIKFFSEELTHKKQEKFFEFLKFYKDIRVLLWFRIEASNVNNYIKILEDFQVKYDINDSDKRKIAHNLAILTNNFSDFDSLSGLAHKIYNTHFDNRSFRDRSTISPEIMAILFIVPLFSKIFKEFKK